MFNILYELIKNKLLFLIFCFIVCTKSYAQGGWDITYIPIDALTNDFIGREVRIDFRTSDKDKIISNSPKNKNKKNIYVNPFLTRIYLGHNDTLNIKLDTVKLIFIEQWQIFVDKGFLEDQYAIILGINKNIVYMKEVHIVSFDAHNIVLEISLYNTFEEFKSKKNEFKNIITINKENIKGIVLEE